MSSLISIAQEKFLQAIRSVQPAPPLRWKVLVVDDHSKRILFRVLKKNDILLENVSTIVENNSPLYDAQPDQEAMYILMPTTQNVQRIISEFSNGRKQFKRVHLFFLDSLSEELFTLLTQSSAEPFLACLTELYLNFWATETQVFSTESPSLFFSIYSPPKGPSRDADAQAIKMARDRLIEEMRFTAKMIVNTCITLNEFPFIRYYFPTHHGPLGPLVPATVLSQPVPSEGKSRWRTNLARGEITRDRETADREYVTRMLAWMVQSTLEEHQKANPDFPKQDRGRQRGTLIITDRAMDPVGPFLHEFTYQAMANDLLPIEDGRRYSYKLRNAKGTVEDENVELDDSDSIWVDTRHMHMREAIDKLMNDFHKFLQENTSFKGDAPASLDAIRDMLATLPQYQEQRSKFSVHLTMQQECMDIFEKRKLPTVAGIEQNCATGLTAEGKTPKTLVEEMVPILDSREIINKDKVRIIALYIQYRQGVPDEDRRRLYQHARLTVGEQDAINSLTHLGVRISRGPADKDIKKSIKTKANSEEEYELSRYKPVLQTVIDDHVSGKLDESIFPYIKDSPANLMSQPSVHAPALPQTTSLRSARPNWHKAAPRGGAAPTGETQQRLLVFVAGGMTYSEMRTAYQRSSMHRKDIIIGSTHIVTPEEFMDDLKVLEHGGFGSRSVPGGLRERAGAFGSLQQYYDSRYLTIDAPPSRTASAPVAERNRLPVAPHLSQSRSFASTISNDTVSSANKLEKKMKGFFKF